MPPLLAILTPVLLILISVPLVLEKVPRNPFYGFRTPKTLSSDSIWYRANKLGGEYFIIAGIAQIAGVAIVFLATPDAAARAAWFTGLITVSLAVAILAWFIQARKL